MKDDPDSAALARYVLGECDRREAEDIRHWVEADPAHAQLLESVRQLWANGVAERPRLDVDALWSRVASQLEVPPSRRQLDVVKPAHSIFARHEAARRFTPVRLVVGAAAAVVVGLSASPRIRAAFESLHAETRPVQAFRDIATQKGQRAQVYLADGTHVVLDAGSKLRFASDLGTSARRDVELSGRAYFDVVHDAARPFTVRTATSLTEDIGTSFVVQAYPSDSAVQVAVASGIVSFVASSRRDSSAASHTRSGSTRTPKLTLQVGDIARLTSDGQIALSHDATLDLYLSWTTGELRFQRTPLSAVAQELGRSFDLDIQLGDPSLADRTLTARFKDEGSDAVLTSLAKVLKLRVSRSGRTIVLYPNSQRPGRRGT